MQYLDIDYSVKIIEDHQLSNLYSHVLVAEFGDLRHHKDVQCVRNYLESTAIWGNLANTAGGVTLVPNYLEYASRDSNQRKDLLP